MARIAGSRLPATDKVFGDSASLFFSANPGATYLASDDRVVSFGGEEKPLIFGIRQRDAHLASDMRAEMSFFAGRAE